MRVEQVARHTTQCFYAPPSSALINNRCCRSAQLCELLLHEAGKL